MPAHTSPFKTAAPDPGAEHRLRMCELLVRDAPGVSACPLEVNRGGTSFSVDTLSAIHASHPDAELTFIVGADTASTLPAWREPARLLELADLAVAGRAGTTREDVLRTLAAVSPVHAGAGAERPAGVRFLELPVIDISSTDVRRHAARGEPIEDLVGAEVASYVAEHRLYREHAEGAG
jgi:nicotinate-nucleotide adenylyltransferase